jgi:hypothetical protein
MSRRNLLAGLAVGVAALGAVAAPALNRTWFARDGRGLSSWWGRQRRSLARAGMNEWSRQVGSDFVVQGESGAAALKLVEVKPMLSAGVRPPEVTRDRAFAATFDAGSAAPAGDRIYAVRHDVYGDMQVYFSPASGSRMTAVFN